MLENNESYSELENLVLRYIDNRRDDLRDLIMVQSSANVERIARRFAGTEPMEDLVQVGYIGLLNALSKFDPNAGVKFSTYSTYLIAGEIKHYLRDRSQTIRQPAWLQELRHKVQKTAAMLQMSLQRPPTQREIADELGISETAVNEVFVTQDILKVASLDATVQNDQDSDSEVERLDAAAYCPEQLSVEDKLLLENSMSQLRDLEKQVLTLFHFEALNQTEIASKLGISCNYVSHILRQSLAKMRRILSQEAQNERILRTNFNDADSEIIDTLTGAYTENFLRSRLEEEVHRASANGSAVGIVVINFNGLNALSKFYGAAAKDSFLQDAADYLKESVRRLDLVCRLGDSGFCCILPGTGEHVPIVRDRLLNKIERWISERQLTRSIDVEVKHASYPVDANSANQLLEQAKTPARRAA
jgi:RNA polymerase sigma-B factor